MKVHRKISALARYFRRIDVQRGQLTLGRIKAYLYQETSHFCVVCLRLDRIAKLNWLGASSTCVIASL